MEEEWRGGGDSGRMGKRQEKKAGYRKSMVDAKEKGVDRKSVVKAKKRGGPKEK